LQGVSALEIERIICEQALLPPSAAFEKSAATNGQIRIAARRGSRVQDLSQHLRGNLDAIVMAAMRREPRERYATAALLGRDIQHHLYGKPIAAVAMGRELRGFKRWVRSIGRALWGGRG
jgi:serine/threonine-protein kinase